MNMAKKQKNLLIIFLILIILISLTAIFRGADSTSKDFEENETSQNNLSGKTVYLGMINVESNTKYKYINNSYGFTFTYPENLSLKSSLLNSSSISLVLEPKNGTPEENKVNIFINNDQIGSGDMYTTEDTLEINGVLAKRVGSYGQQNDQSILYYWKNDGKQFMAGAYRNDKKSLTENQLKIFYEVMQTFKTF